MSYRITADTGGTFTDVTVVTPEGRLATNKALTTPERMWDGVKEALTYLAADVGVELGVLLGQAATFVGVNAGGGGYGDPVARDPQRVLADVREKWVSVERARDVYGVVVRREPAAGFVLDEDATAALRATA